MESFSCSQLASAIMLELCAEVGSVLIPGQLALCYHSVVTLLRDYALSLCFFLSEVDFKTATAGLIT